MFVVTISFKNCPHQIVLRYKTEASMQDAGMKANTEGNTTVSDDFGRVASWSTFEQVHICREEMALALKGRNVEDRIRAQASQSLKQEMQNDPALEFLVDRTPFFNKR